MKPSTRIHTTRRECDAIMLHAVPHSLTADEAGVYEDAEDVADDVKAADTPAIIDRDVHGDRKLTGVPRRKH